MNTSEEPILHRAFPIPIQTRGSYVLSPQTENTDHNIVHSLSEDNQKRKYNSCHFIKCCISCPNFQVFDG